MENVVSEAISAVRARLVEDGAELRRIQAAYPLRDLAAAIMLLDAAGESLGWAAGHATAGDEPDG